MLTNVFLTPDDFQKAESIKSMAMSLGMTGASSMVWEPSRKPVFDMLHELRPDLLFCHSSEVNSNILNALDEYKETRLVIIGDIGGIEVPEGCLVCYEKERPENVVSYLLEPAANAVCIGGKYSDIHSSDVLCVSEQPSRIINKVLKNYKTKIFSFYNYIQDDHRYLGRIPITMFKKLVKSCKVFLDEHGNIQNIMNALVNGATVLTTEKSFFKSDNLITINKDNIEKTLDNCVEEYGSRSKNKNELVKNHTYLSRMSDIMNILGHTEEASSCKKKILDLL